jgi:hypothetical protein
MNWLPRSLVWPGAFAVTVIFVVGAAFVVSAHDGTPLEPDICSTAGSADSAEAPFLAENDAAMTKMMKGMAARPSDDVDADFVAMMVLTTKVQLKWRLRCFAMVATHGSGGSPRKSS